MPSERSTKSASVVPVVVVATMTVQYRNGWKRFAAIWTLIATIRMAVKIAVPTRYPRFMDMVTASPPVSPNVVARIFTTQNASVTAGTLLERSEMPFMICIPIEPDSAGRMVATRVDSLGRARSVVSSPVHDREQIAEGLLAIGGVRGSGAQGLEGAVDGIAASAGVMMEAATNDPTPAGSARAPNRLKTKISSRFFMACLLC